MRPTIDSDEAVQPTLLTSMGNGCVACGQPLATDQRYCLHCGERNGSPRMPFMDGRGRPATALVATPARMRLSANAVLLGGVATLLVALGVGVLIGRTGTTRAATTSPPVQVVTVAAPGASAATGPTGASAPATSAGSTPTSSSSTSGTSSSKHAASSAASTAKKAATKPPSGAVKLGSKGSGRGYTNGKFTGDFFSP